MMSEVVGDGSCVAHLNVPCQKRVFAALGLDVLVSRGLALGYGCAAENRFFS